jgi:hypothetical protein
VPTPKLLSPEGAKQLLQRRFQNQHREWLTGGGQWPLHLGLGMPSDEAATLHHAEVRAWVAAWEQWKATGSVNWVERRWRLVGHQRVPESLVLDSPEHAASLVGHGARWRRAVVRHTQMAQRWPSMANHATLARHFDVLADYSDDDFATLMALVSWLHLNPDSGHYLRQLPVEGLHTKWMGRRTGLVSDLVRLARESGDDADFHALCGLQRSPFRVRMRVLCRQLQTYTAGLADIQAPLAQLAALPIHPSRVLIVENLESGEVLSPMDDTVAIMGLGNAVGLLAELRWVQGATAVYWGDLDTHGLAILNQARAAIPGLVSVLMDEATLLRHRKLLGSEPAQHPGGNLAHLTESERRIFDGLKSDRWGERVRLEQERVYWPYAMDAVERSFAEHPRSAGAS